ncbi:MAG: hypothetical protein HUK14_08085 [Muribaculaceae bacterium]|nr:hypothetical protein [Muribaculaceae bacterium]
MAHFATQVAGDYRVEKNSDVAHPQYVAEGENEKLDAWTFDAKKFFDEVIYHFL